jgi:uncharacterized membrane protein required for colicin V production
MFWTIFGAVLFASFAMMVREGLWSNTISLINIIVSGLVAFGFYSPLTIWLDERTGGRNTYWLDFVCIWVVFIVTMVVVRAIAGAASGTRLRFKNPIDPVGGPLVGFIAAWVLTAFVMATLHMSPMPKDAFGGKLVLTQQEINGKQLLGSALLRPDLAWLRFVEKVSTRVSLGSSETKPFNAWMFVGTYELHRTKFQAATGLQVERN